MPTSQQIAWIERAVWILIYGGLFIGLLGWVAARWDPGLRIPLMAAGALAVASGVVLVWLRSRLTVTDRDNAGSDTQNKGAP